MNPTQTPAHTDPTPAVLLRRAADHIERHGFNQGSYYSDANSPTPAVCAVGAIGIAAYGAPADRLYDPDEPEFPNFAAAHDWLADYLAANLDRHQGELIGIYAWNDSPHTTSADVVDALRAAADAWDAENAGGDRA